MEDNSKELYIYIQLTDDYWTITTTMDIDIEFMILSSRENRI